MNTTISLKNTLNILGIVILLFLLAACGQKPIQEVTEKALFSDADLNKARKVSSLEKQVTPSIEVDMPQGKTVTEEVTTDSGDFVPQAVLPGEGAKGIIAYIRHNPTAANPWAIILFDQVADTKTVIYSGQRELDSVAVNSNGIKVIFSARETTAPTSDYEVYILDLVASTTTQLTSNDFDDINVSHTSNATGLIAYEDLRPATNTRSVRWYDGTTTFRLNSNVNDTMPSISGDGTFIAFVRQTTTGLFQVRRYEIATTTNTSIVSNANIKKHPSVSENGIKVAWVETLVNGNQQLRIKDTVANSTTNIFSNANGIEHAHLRSDGNYITFGLLNNGFIRVYMRDLISNTSVQGASGANNVKGMYWGYKQLLPSDVRVVRADAPAGGDGTSWASAYRYLQDALYEAHQNLDSTEIWVAAGVYYPDEAEIAPGISNNDRTETFLLTRSAIGIYGGFIGTETQQSQRDFTIHKSILSGDIEQNDTNTDGNNIAEQVSNIQGNNSYHVFSADGLTGLAILDGFTLTAGKANGGIGTFGGIVGGTVGGGMRNIDGDPTLRNLVFTGNTATDFGGGLYNDNSASSLYNITFNQNSAQQGGGIYNDNSNLSMGSVTFFGNIVIGDGGGMYNRYSSPDMNNITFSDNVATQGAGMYNLTGSAPTLSIATFLFNNASRGGGIYHVGGTLTLNSVTFRNNFATLSGGGLHLSSGPSSVTINLSNVTFLENSTDGVGGGIYNNLASITLKRGVFDGNSAVSTGGGFYNRRSSPTLTNVVFKQNNSPYGGAIYNISTSGVASTPVLTNVTFYANTSSSAGGAIRNTSTASTNVVNSIFFANTGGTIANSAGSSTTINYSLLDIASLPASTTGSDNILNAANPFTNSAAFDLTLSSTPCNNGGNACAIDSGDKLTPGLVGVTTDLAGNPRFRDIAAAANKGTGTVPHVDMGAYEKQ